MSVFRVPETLAGQRVDAAAARISGASRSRVEDVLAAGGVRLDGEIVTRGSQRVAGGELLEVELGLKPDAVAFEPREVAGLRIVHEDTDIIVVDKPAGVAAHPSFGWEGPSVTEGLAAVGVPIATSGAAERQGVVQRLDVGTSGLMTLAKSEHAYSVLKQAFRDRAVDKTYHALVHGHPDPMRGTIEAPIGRDPRHEWRMAIVEGGRASTTHYDQVEMGRSTSLLEVKLETGRTHQIRVHLHSLGHACVGDPLYGPRPEDASHYRLERQWLHAVHLGFEHPATGEWVTFSSEYPPDLAYALFVARTD